MNTAVGQEADCLLKVKFLVERKGTAFPGMPFKMYVPGLGRGKGRAVFR